MQKVAAAVVGVFLFAFVLFIGVAIFTFGPLS
jgi:hypothetical protein